MLFFERKSIFSEKYEKSKIVIIVLCTFLALAIVGVIGYVTISRTIAPASIRDDSPARKGTPRSPSINTTKIHTPKEISVPVDIELFVRRFQFPQYQGTFVRLDIAEHDVKVFQTYYGASQDCLEGCINSTAIGIQHQNTIGWIQVNDVDDIDTSSLPFYDFTKQDSYLFTDDFFRRLEEKADLVYQQGFLPLVAADPDTPPDTLLKIAEGLPFTILPSVASALLENPKVRSNRQILTIIKQLPVFRGDAYGEVRSGADRLLDELQ